MSKCAAHVAAREDRSCDPRLGTALPPPSYEQQHGFTLPPVSAVEKGLAASAEGIDSADLARVLVESCF